MNEIITKINLKNIKPKTKIECILNGKVKSFFPCSMIENKHNTYLIHNTISYTPLTKVHKLKAVNLIRLIKYIVFNIEMCSDYLFTMNEYELNENCIFIKMNDDNMVIDVKFIYIPKSKERLSFNSNILNIIYVLKRKAEDEYSIDMLEHLVEEIESKKNNYINLFSILEKELNEAQLVSNIKY